MTSAELEQLHQLFDRWLTEALPNGPNRVTPAHKRIAAKIAEDAGRERAQWDAAEHEAVIGEVLVDVQSAFYVTADGGDLRYWVKNYESDVFGPFTYHEITHLPNWQAWVAKLNARLFEQQQAAEGEMDG